MKKEKIYSSIYAFVLGSILVVTSMSAQLAYNDVLPSKLDNHEVTVTKTVVNTDAIAEISNHLKNGLDILKHRQDLGYAGKLVAEVVITAKGHISSVSIIEGGNASINEVVQSLIADIEKVSPITYNGNAKRKAVWIPVTIEK